MPREDIYAPRLPKGNDDQQQTTGPDADNYFNTYIGAEPSTLDISRRMDSYSSIVMMNTMEGLVRADADENGDLVIIPGWSNPEYDRIITEASSEMDEAKRLQGYIDAETILIKDECVVSPMATNQVQQFYQPYVKGYNRVPYTNTSYMFYYTEGRGAK